jgi:D-arabinose 1-dehydrogenase-like Zn-dependent alcohol dehydrogenase
MVILNTSATAIPYALSLTRSHGLIVFTGAPNEVTLGSLDYIIRDITAIGTLNGTAQDMEAAADMSVKYGIWSKIRPYDFDEESMRRMIKDVQGKEWSGKAVVRVDPDLWD